MQPDQHVVCRSISRKANKMPELVALLFTFQTLSSIWYSKHTQGHSQTPTRASSSSLSSINHSADVKTEIEAADGTEVYSAITKRSDELLN